MSTSSRHKITPFQTQLVENISPIKEEVEDMLPANSLLDWSIRSKWTGNRCQRTIYRSTRTFHTSVWLYFVPFLALATNFAVPFLSEKYGNHDVIEDRENMSGDYLQWLEETISSTADPDYDELSIDELVELMKEIPFETDEWV